jgi:hypothetical protein
MSQNNSLRIQVPINKNFNYRMFKWYELGILGCGQSGSPFIDMSNWVDLDTDQARDVEQEINNIVQTMKFAHQPYNGAYIPEDINGQKFVNYFIYRAREYIPADVLETFINETYVAMWVYKNKLTPTLWKEMGNIMNPNFSEMKDSLGKFVFQFDKITTTPGEWIEDTPLLKQWINSWNLFDNVGRISVFKNQPGSPVCIHRDTSFAPTKMHQVSIQFSKNRPAFVYDEVKQKKIYYNTPVYFFNSIDCHGVDAGGDEVYTVRIDGLFKPEVCKKLGLVDEYVWKPDYFSGQKLKKIKVFEPEERP